MLSDSMALENRSRRTKAEESKQRDRIALSSTVLRSDCLFYVYLTECPKTAVGALLGNAYFQPLDVFVMSYKHSEAQQLLVAPDRRMEKAPKRQRC